MKKILIFILFINSPVLAENVPAISDVRIMFHNAASGEDSCKDLIRLLEPFNEIKNPLLLGYRGSSTILMAKHVINPYSKLSYFKKGKGMLEKAIQSDPKNIELRFLRYTIQTNIPAFLSYNSQIENDRRFLTQSLSRMSDNELKKIILSYLNQYSPAG